MKQFKFSKTYVAAFLYRFAFLLFVPLLQGLLFAHRGALTLVTLYGTDLLIAVLLLSVAVIRCSKLEVIKTEKTAEIRGGVIIKTAENNLLKKRGSIVLSQGLFLRVFGAHKLKIFSGSTFSTAFLKQNDAAAFLDDLITEEKEKTVPSGIFRSLLMSVSFSNALTGLLAAVPLIRRAAAVLGARQTALIIEGASLTGLLSFTGLPPTLTRISTLLFLCWIIGASTEFFSEYGLKVSFYREKLVVSKGLILKTKAVFDKKSVRGVIFRQSLLMFMLGLYSAVIAVNIKPKRKIHVLSAATRTGCADLEDMLFGEKGKRIMYLTPPKASLWGYTYLPILCLAATSLGIIAFPQKLIIKALLGVLSGIFSVWFLFRTVALYRTSLCIWTDFAEVKYFSGMNFIRTVFRLSDVTSAQITQSIFQRFNGRCNLILRVGNSKALRIKIKHLRLKDLEKYKKTGSP
ncbi:MAG: hypothetical protein IJ451_05370 [Ruminococcus sp.]|nr:hypothetical protein [Ruminococcus sp.]